MSLDTELVLIGTGLAPLLAAFRLRSRYAKIWILNPHFDFFLEDSELPFNPDWPLGQGRDDDSFEEMFQLLQSYYPGSLAATARPSPDGAPQIRARRKVVIQGKNLDLWTNYEHAFVKRYSELKPQSSEGLLALKHFPGVNLSKIAAPDRFAGLQFTRFGEIDIESYRAGILEFMRDQANVEILTNVHPIEFRSDGILFRLDERTRSIGAPAQVAVFWTSGIQFWLDQLFRKFDLGTAPIRKSHSYEEWQLISKNEIDAENLGLIDDAWVWAVPERGGAHAVHILRKTAEKEPFGEASFRAVRKLVDGFLHWDSMTIRQLRHRETFEPASSMLPSILQSQPYKIELIPNSDGPVSRVARSIEDWSEDLR